MPMRVLLFVFMLGFTSILLSQEQEYLQAKVLDKETGEPVVFATVRLIGKAKGVITNMDGGFRLPVSYRQEAISVEISSMGYSAKTINLQELSLTVINLIYVQPAQVSLAEAVVSAKKKRGPSATLIVRKAIENIPKNYPITPFSTVGYYRDYQLRDAEYINLNEAILEVQDGGFKTNDHKDSQVVIYEYLANTAFEQDDDALLAYDYKTNTKVIKNAHLQSYGGNEFTILRIHDALRNYQVSSYDFVRVMEQDFITNHLFRKESSITQDNEQLFVISFKQAEQRNRVVGKMYISKQDFAIHKMEYTLYDRYKRLGKNVQDKHGVNFETILEVTVAYKRNNGKMFPNYISFFNPFTVRKPPKLAVVEVILDVPTRCFVAEFSTAVDINTASRAANYDIGFGDKKITINRLVVLDNKVHLFPKTDDKDFKNLLTKLNANSEKQAVASEQFSFDVKRVMDKELTAVVNESEHMTYQQYREFFVQEIKPKVGVLGDSLYMNKYRPIFKNQPKSKPENFSDYWMNTPLQNTKQ